jgi:hypothetical protein
MKKVTKSKVDKFVREKLSSNYAWASKAVVRIFNENQMEDEKNSDSAIHQNNIGFSGTDSEILSSFAKQIIAGRSLSTKQSHILLKLMPKYARQVIAFSDVEKLNSMVEKA